MLLIKLEVIVMLLKLIGGVVVGSVLALVVFGIVSVAYNGMVGEYKGLPVESYMNRPALSIDLAEEDTGSKVITLEEVEITATAK